MNIFILSYEMKEMTNQKLNMAGKWKKVLKIFSVSVLVLSFFSLFAYSIRYVALGGSRLGIITKPLDLFSSFPGRMKEVLTSDELSIYPLTYLKKDTSILEINNLNYDLYGLNSFYNNHKKRWDIKLFNFRDDSVIHTWYLYKRDFLRTGKRQFQNSRPKNPLLLPDRSLIVLCAETNNLYRLDRESNVIWHNTKKNFHHSINLDLDGNIWTCTSGERGFKPGRIENPQFFRDDFITSIDLETGEILQDKSLCDLFIENDYPNFIYGFSNAPQPEGDDDPFHLNDIEPVLKNGPFWNKRDLFLSLRHKSLVIHYRPESGRIIRLIYGPFLNQHDVDIISDSEIAIFNNNSTAIGRIETERTDPASTVHDELIYSEILVYNYEDSTYHTYLKDLFEKEDIYTRTEGLFTFLSTGDLYLESQNDGILYILDDDSILLKKQFTTSIENMVHLPNWVRIYENINF